MTHSSHLIIAAGGTGGHMFPAQALAEEMLARGWQVTLSTDPRGARYATGFPPEVARVILNSGTPARGGMIGRALLPWQIGSGIATAFRLMSRTPPRCVAGFGGYPALPAMAAACMQGLPRLIHEQNGVLGRVNALFAGRVHAIACGTWPTALPEGIDAHDIGNPVRSAIAQYAGAPYSQPDREGALRVLVIGGSQGAQILSQIVPVALAQMPLDMRTRLIVSHQARDEDATMVRATYEAAGIRADIAPFFEDVPERLSQCHLVVSRSGASSIADIATIGRPSILIPLASALRGEQMANANGLVGAGAAELMIEAHLTEERLKSAITTILNNPERAKAMAIAAHSQARPNARRALADLVENVATRPRDKLGKRITG